MKHRVALMITIFCMMIVSSLQGIVLSASDAVPVIYSIVKGEQPDSLEYNIVVSLTSIVYKGIMEGKVKLWDSQKKQINLMPSTLQGIEKSSDTKFSEVENIYVYELWETKKSELRIKTLGFEFVKMMNGKVEVNYGYVENDEAQELFKTSFMETNADGFSSLPYEYVLKLKKYRYNIIQFGSEVVKTKDESERIRKLAFERNNYMPDFNEIRQEKRITYLISENHRLKDDKMLENGNLFLLAVEDYLNNNLSTYYRLMGISFSDSILNNPPKHINVSKAEISEIWNKNDDYISFQPDSIIIYVGDNPLKAVMKDEFVKWDMVVDFKGIEDFLKEKRFFYMINKINSQMIIRSKSYKYQQALFNADWHQINKYVKESE